MPALAMSSVNTVSDPTDPYFILDRTVASCPSADHPSSGTQHQSTCSPLLSAFRACVVMMTLSGVRRDRNCSMPPRFSAAVCFWPQGEVFIRSAIRLYSIRFDLSSVYPDDNICVWYITHPVPFITGFGDLKERSKGQFIIILLILGLNSVYQILFILLGRKNDFI